MADRAAGGAACVSPLLWCPADGLQVRDGHNEVPSDAPQSCTDWRLAAGLVRLVDGLSAQTPGRPADTGSSRAAAPLQHL